MPWGRNSFAVGEFNEFATECKCNEFFHKKTFLKWQHL